MTARDYYYIPKWLINSKDTPGLPAWVNREIEPTFSDCVHSIIPVGMSWMVWYKIPAHRMPEWNATTTELG